jgi:uncharacterized protein
MPADPLGEARKYLITCIEGKYNYNESVHPWRKGWEFVALHAFQVEAYVQKILARQPHTLSDGEIVRLRLAAILHDIGRLDGKDDHAQRGARLVDEWLQARPDIREQIEDADGLLELIASHSQKDAPETDFSKAVLKDADILDEIGALSVFMASNWIERGSPFFFHQLRQRLEQFELPFCERQLARLNTQAGRAILDEKRAFIEMFINQLDGELACDVEAYERLQTMKESNLG